MGRENEVLLARFSDSLYIEVCVCIYIYIYIVSLCAEEWCVVFPFPVYE